MNLFTQQNINSIVCVVMPVGRMLVLVCCRVSFDFIYWSGLNLCYGAFFDIFNRIEITKAHNGAGL